MTRFALASSSHPLPHRFQCASHLSSPQSKTCTRFRTAFTSLLKCLITIRCPCTLMFSSAAHMVHIAFVMASCATRDLIADLAAVAHSARSRATTASQPSMISAQLKDLSTGQWVTLSTSTESCSTLLRPSQRS